MSKRILLIDSDEAFAKGLSSAITSRGFVASMATNSEQGMSLAKKENPDLIVVCVEAQPTNGYMLCTRLKKDDALKDIPVILTSANATPDSFEKHKKLKTRAEEYLIKPFEPKMMLEKASALLGVDLPADAQEEEIVQLDDEPLGLGDLVDGEDEPISLTEADAQEARSAGTEEPLLVEEVEEIELRDEVTGGDDDLDMFDKAFDSLGAPALSSHQDGTQRFAEAQPTAEPASEPEPVVAEPAAAQEPEPVLADDDESFDLLGGAAETPVVMGVGADDDVTAQLEARIAALEQSLAERDAELSQAKKGPASSGEVLKLKEAKNKSDKEVLRLKEELNQKDKELVELQEQHTALEARVQELEDEAAKREAAAKALQQRADALAAAAKKFERELSAAKEEAKKAGASGSRLAELEKENAALEKRAAKLEAELETLRTDLNAAVGEKDLVSEEREELKKQLEEAQAAAATNEDRAVKAYQKLKGDEKLRGKTRKALEIALQLLQDDAADNEDEDAEKQPS